MVLLASGSLSFIIQVSFSSDSLFYILSWGELFRISTLCSDMFCGWGIFSMSSHIIDMFGEFICKKLKTFSSWHHWDFFLQFAYKCVMAVRFCQQGLRITQFSIIMYVKVRCKRSFMFFSLLCCALHQLLFASIQVRPSIS